MVPGASFPANPPTRPGFRTILLTTIVKTRVWMDNGLHTVPGRTAILILRGQNFSPTSFLKALKVGPFIPNLPAAEEGPDGYYRL